jgi:sec-independent protein translocase protein TatB
MLDFSWSELALIGVVALVVIGPKDLPKALRTAGIWVRKARTISREFQSSVEQMMREAELDEVKKELESVSSINIEKEIEKAVDPTGDLAESLKPPEMPDLNNIINDSAPPAPPAAPAVPQGEAAAAPTPALASGDTPPSETLPGAGTPASSADPPPQPSKPASAS